MKRGKIKGTRIKTRAIKCMGEHPALEYEAEGDQDLGIKTVTII